MKNDFKIDLPNWGFNRLLKEACTSWNLRHPDSEQANPIESPWPLLYNAVLTFLRHCHTDYDQMLSLSGGDELVREQLRAEIFAAAMKLYPWLRLGSDPRVGQSVRIGRAAKFYDRISSELSDLVSRRGQIVTAVNELKRKRSLETKQRIAVLQIELQQLQEDIEVRTRAFKTAPEIAGVEITPEIKGFRLEIMRQSEPVYLFGDLPLAECYTESAGFRCPNCNNLVKRTKVARDYGAGFK